MDFIIEFPRVDDMNIIMDVIDRIIKYAVFVPTSAICITKVTTRLFYRNMVKFFGVPLNIISDCDMLFTGRFWTTLFIVIGTILKFSIANHLQIDRQMKKINIPLEEYLRHCV